MEKTFKIDSDFSEYKNYFLEENSKRNLISKNDEKFLYEKHIYDSLSIKLFFEKYNIKNANILDIGCGGGFPCLPIAIEFPQMKITGIILITLQVIAIISRIIQQKSFLELGFLGLIGYFIFGIIGIILLVKSQKKK